MNSTKLNFINRSNDTSNSRVVIFQKPTTTTFDELTIAWKVIKNCGQGDYHPFLYEYGMQVTAGDSWGNFTQPLAANPGDRFKMIKDNTGDVMRKADESASTPSSVEVLNALPKGSISANIYRSGQILAQKKVVAPGQKAVFDFKPSIFIGVASEIEQGQIIDSAVLSNINKEIYLTGLISADIVMTGGGRGESATPFQFTLENKVLA